MSIADIAGPLREAGLTVVELDGWATRGESDGGFSPLGVIWHHDGMGLGFDSDPSNDNNVAQFMSQNGNDGAQIWIRKDGVVHLLASGRKWHAGIGRGWNDIPANSGNTYAVGIETDHTFGNPWTDALVDAIITTSAVLGEHYGWSTSNMCGHKEYAPDRKPDPESIDCNDWRNKVDARRPTLGQNNPPAPTPVPEEGLTVGQYEDIMAAIGKIQADTTVIRRAVIRSGVAGVADENGKASGDVADIAASILSKVKAKS
jgi:hypothetical protein